MKKIRDLNVSSVQVLDKKELKQLNGGILWFFTLLGGSILADAILSGRESIDAIMKGYESTQ